MQEFTVRTARREQFVNIDGEVRNIIDSSGVQDGYCIVYTPHTTAAVTTNENADPDVPRDMLMELAKIVPSNDPEYRHGEGNSDSHVKSSLVGCSETVLIEKGRMIFGTWQSLFFCEFDGPRTRKVYVRVMEK